MKLSLPHIREALHNYAPSDLPDSDGLAHAAVALILRESADARAEVLMIRRAEHPKDPWSGQMGFPGGRADSGDESLHYTAIRETKEELGICLESASKPLGRLSELRARSKMRVQPLSIIPYICHLTEPVGFRLNHEVIEALWIPLEFFTDDANRTRMEHPLDPNDWLPCYHYQDRHIWGLSLAMIDELLQKVLRI